MRQLSSSWDEERISDAEYIERLEEMLVDAAFIIRDLTRYKRDYYAAKDFLIDVEVVLQGRADNDKRNNTVISNQDQGDNQL